MQKHTFSILVILILLQLFSCSDSPTEPFPDYLAPTIQWRTLAADSILSGNVELGFTVTDQSVVADVEIYRNGSLPDEWELVYQDEPFYTVDWDTREVADGVYTLEVRATDANGNLGISPSLVVTVKNGTGATDTQEPVITWVYPTSESAVAGDIVLAFNVLDASDITAITLFRNGYMPTEWALTPHDDSLYTLEWDTREVADGNYLIEVRAVDDAGNLGISPTLQLKVANGDPPPAGDRLPPDVWWTAPAGASTVEGSVTLELAWFDEVDVDSVALYLDGAQMAVYKSVTVQGSQRYVWESETVADGVHLWEAKAWDSSGNVGKSLSLLLVVDNDPEVEVDHDPPVIQWLSPTPGDALEGEVQIRFQALDNVGVDSVYLWVNGVKRWSDAGGGDSFFEATLNLDFHDGKLYISAGAVDTSNNLQVIPPISFYLWNNRPEVIWVPDDFETIQGAIWASENGDTVRVRAGTYEEGIWFLGKNIWLESEDGPEVTWIKGIGWSQGIRVHGGVKVMETVIRGFRVSSSGNGIGVLDDNGISVYNCLVDMLTEDTEDVNGIWLAGEAQIQNCVIKGADWGIVEGYSIGHLRNCIIIDCNLGYRKISSLLSRQSEHHNIYWNNMENFWNRDPDATDLFADPLFEENTYILSEDSPAINAGDPTISDLNGTRSDIGLYGGPYSYTNP